MYDADVWKYYGSPRSRRAPSSLRLCGRVLLSAVGTLRVTVIRILTLMNVYVIEMDMECTKVIIELEYTDLIRLVMFCFIYPTKLSTYKATTLLQDDYS